VILLDILSFIHYCGRLAKGLFMRKYDIKLFEIYGVLFQQSGASLRDVIDTYDTTFVWTDEQVEQIADMQVGETVRVHSLEVRRVN
jgi:hypothetical protein